MHPNLNGLSEYSFQEDQIYIHDIDDVEYDSLYFIGYGKRGIIYFSVVRH